MVAVVMATTPAATTRADVSLTGLGKSRNSPIGPHRTGRSVGAAVIAGVGQEPLTLHREDSLHLGPSIDDEVYCIYSLLDRALTGVDCVPRSGVSTTAASTTAPSTMSSGTTGLGIRGDGTWRVPTLGGQRRSETGLDRSETSAVKARIIPSWEYEANSSPSSVNTWPRTNDIPLPTWTLS